MSLTYYIREYAKDRNGRIGWWRHILLYVSKAGKRKRLIRNCDKSPFPEKIGEHHTGPYAYFVGRAAQCHNVLKWNGEFPIFNIEEGRIPYVTVPAKDCKACEFHEPAKHYGSKRYASCRWYRDNSGMPSMLELWAKSLNQAKEMLGQ